MSEPLNNCAGSVQLSIPSSGHSGKIQDRNYEHRFPNHTGFKSRPHVFPSCVTQSKFLNLSVS